MDLTSDDRFIVFVRADTGRVLAHLADQHGYQHIFTDY